MYRASRPMEPDCGAALVRGRVGARSRTRTDAHPYAHDSRLSFSGKNVSNLAEKCGCNGTILPKNE